MPNVRSPGLMNENLAETARLRPTGGSLTLKLIGTSEGTITLPDTDESEINIHSWISVYTHEGFEGIYRVTNIAHQLKKQRDITILHGIDILSDSVWNGQTEFEGNKAEFLTALLNQQTHLIGGVKPWVMGTCEDTGTVKKSINFDRLSTLFEGLVEEGGNYAYVYDQTTWPWTVSLVALDQVVRSEFRLTRNILSASVTHNDAEMCNRLVLSVNITSVDNDGNETTDTTIHTYDNLASQNHWHEVVVKTADIDAESIGEANAWANAFLEKRADPAIQIQLEASDYFHLTGEPLDRAALGKLSRVALPAYGETFTERAVTLTYPDLFKPDAFNPMRVSVSLANTLPKFSENIASAQKEAASASRSARSAARTAEKTEKEVTHWEQVVSYQGAALDGSGITTLYESGISLDATGGAKIFSLTQGLQALYAEHSVTSSLITSLVQSSAPVPGEAFSDSTDYQAGAEVTYGGSAYRFIKAHPHGPWIGTTGENADVVPLPATSSRVQQAADSIVSAVGDIGTLSGRVSSIEGTAVYQNSASIAAIVGKFEIDSQTNKLKIKEASGIDISDWATKLGFFEDGDLTSGFLIKRINGDTTEAGIKADKVYIESTTQTTVGNKMQLSSSGIMQIKGQLLLGEGTYPVQVNNGKVISRQFQVENGSLTFVRTDGTVGTWTLNCDNVAKLLAVSASVDNNVLTIVDAAGKTTTFSKATTLSGAWSGGKLTVTAKQKNKNTSNNQIVDTDVGTYEATVTSATDQGYQELSDYQSYYQSTIPSLTPAVTHSEFVQRLPYQFYKLSARDKDGAVVYPHYIGIDASALVSSSSSAGHDQGWDDAVAVTQRPAALSGDALDDDFTAAWPYTRTTGGTTTRGTDTLTYKLRSTMNDAYVQIDGANDTVTNYAHITHNQHNYGKQSVSLNKTYTSASYISTSAAQNPGTFKIQTSGRKELVDGAWMVREDVDYLSITAPTVIVSKSGAMSATEADGGGRVYKGTFSFSGSGTIKIAQIDTKSVTAAGSIALELTQPTATNFQFDQSTGKYTYQTGASVKVDGTANVLQRIITGLELTPTDAITHGQNSVSAELAETVSSASAPASLVSGKTYKLFRTVNGARQSQEIGSYTVPAAVSDRYNDGWGAAYGKVKLPSSGETNDYIDVETPQQRVDGNANKTRYSLYVTQNDAYITVYSGETAVNYAKKTHNQYTNGQNSVSAVLAETASSDAAPAALVSGKTYKLFKTINGARQTPELGSYTVPEAAAQQTVNVSKDTWGTGNDAGKITFSPSPASGDSASVHLAWSIPANTSDGIASIEVKDTSSPGSSSRPISTNMSKTLTMAETEDHLYISMMDGGNTVARIDNPAKNVTVTGITRLAQCAFDTENNTAVQDVRLTLSNGRTATFTEDFSDIYRAGLREEATDTTVYYEAEYNNGFTVEDDQDNVLHLDLTDIYLKGIQNATPAVRHWYTYSSGGLITIYKGGTTSSGGSISDQIIDMIGKTLRPSTEIAFYPNTQVEITGAITSTDGVEYKKVTYAGAAYYVLPENLFESADEWPSPSQYGRKTGICNIGSGAVTMTGVTLTQLVHTGSAPILSLYLDPEYQQAGNYASSHVSAADFDAMQTNGNAGQFLNQILTANNHYGSHDASEYGGTITHKAVFKVEYSEGDPDYVTVAFDSYANASDPVLIRCAVTEVYNYYENTDVTLDFQGNTGTPDNPSWYAYHKKCVRGFSGRVVNQDETAADYINGAVTYAYSSSLPSTMTCRFLVTKYYDKGPAETVVIQKMATREEAPVEVTGVTVVDIMHSSSQFSGTLYIKMKISGDIPAASYRWMEYASTGRPQSFFDRQSATADPNGFFVNAGTGFNAYHNWYTSQADEIAHKVQLKIHYSNGTDRTVDCTVYSRWTRTYTNL